MSNQPPYPPPPDSPQGYAQPYPQQYVQVPGYLPYASWEQPPMLRQSGIGIASFIIGTLMGVMQFVVVLVAGMMGLQGNVAPESLQAIGCIYILGLLACVVGVILGIAGIKQQNRKKIFAILGLSINGIVLLLAASVLAFGLAMKK